MAVNFFNYKQELVNLFDNRNAQDAFRPPFATASDTEFYQLSFHNRVSAELEYKLLTMLLKIDNIPDELKERTEYYLEAGAHLLQRDALIAENTAEARKYSDKIDECNRLRDQRAQAPAVMATADIPEWRKSVDQFYNDLLDFLSAPQNVSKFITLLSYVNLYRLVSVFSRLSFKSFWTVASQWHWIDAQDKLFGYPIQRSTLDLPVGLLNFLSVALFALRLGAHIAMILKHALSERPGEKDISRWERIKREFSARMMHLMNDIAWVIINLLTNYAAVWHIADPLSNMLLAITLAWDCTWLGIHWYREERDWALKKTELLAWKVHPSAHSPDKGLIDLQLQMLADLKLETRAKYLFMIVAGVSITTAYLLVLANISALVSTVCLITCIIGFAMYGSADEFSSLVRTRWGQIQSRDEETRHRDLAAIQSKFFKTFTMTLVPPFIVMGLLSIGWQAAFLGAIGAVIYAYMPSKRPQVGNNAGGPALIMPPVETDALALTM